ncbi:MAG: peroxiredoxin family protein [Actinomycetota bacterium]|nr:peroxiredoxin family protein [Actinomycetota bacterium]
MLSVGDLAPSFSLPALDGGGTVADPWTEGPTVITFFKVSCPVCKMVAPMLTALAEGGVRVVAIGEDPPDELTTFGETEGQRVPTLSESAPYEVSAAYGLEAVPAIFLVGPDGAIVDSVASWDRDRWNALATTAGFEGLVSTPEDGLRPFRPG